MTDEPTGANQPAARDGDTNPARSEPSETKALTPEQVSEIMNRAITARFRAFEPQLEAKFNDLAQRLAPVNPTDAPAGDAPRKAGKENLEVAALRKQLEQIQAERETEKNKAAELSRDAALRRAVESTGTHQVEALFRFLKADPSLQLGEDGAYFGIDKNGGHLSVDEFAQDAFNANPWARPATGRGGGGGAGQPAGGSPQRQGAQMSKADYEAKLDEHLAAGDMSAMMALQHKALVGEIAVEGITDTKE